MLEYNFYASLTIKYLDTFRWSYDVIEYGEQDSVKWHFDC